MASSDDFDPYLNWLDIQPHEHPLDYYRLLGLAQFENDRQKIESAADERMRHVRQFQTGPRGRHTQKLLNELTTAKLCLLNPNIKSTYDAVLEGQLALSIGPSPPPAPPEPRLSSSKSAAANQATAPTAVAVPPPPPEAPRAVEKSKPTAKTTAEDTPSVPLYARPWFPFAVIGSIVAVVGLVIGVVQLAKYMGKSADGGQQAAVEEKQPLDVKPIVEPPKPVVEQSTDSDAVVIHQAGDGSFAFNASVATIHGANARLSKRGDDDFITDWTSDEDWLSWQFEVVNPGFFQVFITYAADEQCAEARYQLAVGDRKVGRDVNVPDPPGGEVTDELFILVQRAGRNTLTLRAVEIRAERLMDLKQIRFIPKTRRAIP